MVKVYLAMFGEDYEGEQVLRIFSSKEAAEKYIAKEEKENEFFDPACEKYWVEEFSVEEA